MKRIITIKGVFKAILFIYLLSTLNYGQKYYSPYFPMAFGKTWYYTSNDYPDTLVSSIVDTATIKNNLYYCFAPYGPNPNWQRYWLRPEANQIFVLNSQDSTEYLLFN